MHFWKKEIPQTPVYLSSGRKVTFDTVDGVTGYTITADPAVTAELNACVARGIGGVSSASKEEYDAFLSLKKNGTTRPKSWREELGPQQLFAQGAAGPVAVARPPQQFASQAATPVPAPAAAPEQAPRTNVKFTPKTAKKAKT